MRGSIGYRVFLGILFAFLLAGCGGGDSAGLPSSAADTPAASVDEPGALASLAVQDGVEPELWDMLTAELGRVLAERDALATRTASAPPMGEASATILSYNAGAATLSWRYYSHGDYNQDGLVGISDLTPLGQHYGEGSPLGAGQPFPPDSLGAVIDGNGDGIINISDITQIGQNYGVLALGYNVYMSTDEGDYPASSSDDNGPGTSQTGYVALADAASVTDGRKLLEYTLPEDTVAGYYWVRPTDGETDGTPSSLAQVSAGNLNIPPIAVLSASPAEGLVPLTVSFHAFSSIDPDGVISTYHWDYDGLVGPLELVDTGEQGWTEHTYDEAGDYLALLAVVDDDGGIAEDFATIRVREPIPPTAHFDWSPSSGPAPLKVSLDASGSHDPDGIIVRYEWDWNKDGEYNYDAGGEPTADIYYYEPALYTYTIQLRVTDNDGLTAIALRDVIVEPGAVWHTETILTASHDGGTSEGTRIYSVAQPLDVGGYPALFYTWQMFENTETDSEDSLQYTRALDPYGTAWDEPVVLHSDDQRSDGYHFAFSALIQDRPAVLFNHGVSWDNFKDTWFILAEDEFGSSWSSPVLVSESQLRPVSPIAVVGGHPMFVEYDGVRLYRSVDDFGSSWEKTTPFPGVLLVNSSLIEVASQPGIAFRHSDDLLYFRALGATGTHWPSIPMMLDSVAEVQHAPMMVVAAGHPAISYYDKTLRLLKYMRAEDPLGESWGEPLVLAAWTEGNHSMALLEGRPAIMYEDHDSGDRLFIAANNEEGTSWSLPLVITAECPVPEASPGTLGWELIIVGNQPTLSYQYEYTEGYIQHSYYGIVMYH